jgi:hypothetical protein
MSKIIILFVIIFATLILFSCGQGNNPSESVDLSNTAVVWQGNIQENQDYMNFYLSVKQCLESIGMANNTVPPYIVVTLPFTSFLCNGYVASGCAIFSTNTIYISGFYGSAPDENLWTYTFKHQLVHIITFLGDEVLNTTPALTCTDDNGTLVLF